MRLARLHMLFSLPTAVRALVEQVVISMVAAAFAFHFFLYGYCTQFRPREPMPDLGLDHPFNLKGRLVYVSSFESLFLKGLFFWMAILFIVVFLCRSTVGRVLQYDVRRGKIAWAPPPERVDWRRFAILVALWLALLVAGWRASL